MVSVIQNVALRLSRDVGEQISRNVALFPVIISVLQIKSVYVK
jgi:hypothetical protein